MSTLALKFGSLLFKTLSKPLAARLSQHAMDHNNVRSFIVRLGQTAHAVETRLTLQLSGHHAKLIKPLSEEEAKLRGSSVLSEGIVFATAGLAILVEMTRKAVADRKKSEAAEEVEMQRRWDVMSRIEGLDARLVRVERDIMDSARQQSEASRYVRQDLDQLRQSIRMLRKNIEAGQAQAQAQEQVQTHAETQTEARAYAQGAVSAQNSAVRRHSASNERQPVVHVKLGDEDDDDTGISMALGDLRG